VKIEEAAEALTTRDGRVVVGGRRGGGEQPVVQALVVALPVVVVHELKDGVPQVPLGRERDLLQLGFQPQAFEDVLTDPVLCQNSIVADRAENPRARCPRPDLKSRRAPTHRSAGARSASLSMWERRSSPSSQAPNQPYAGSVVRRVSWIGPPMEKW